MYRQILVPTDGSTGTAHVAMQAFDLAERYDATVHLLHVVDSDIGSILVNAAEPKAELREGGQQAVEILEALSEGYDIEITSELREGDPTDEILAYATEIDADLIVMGTHGRSGMERRLIGSVTERIVRHSERPVLTVRLPDTNHTVTEEAEAADIVSESLEADGFARIDIDGTDRQRSVWVVNATADGVALTVYVDPVTRRTSAVRRSEPEST